MKPSSETPEQFTAAVVQMCCSPDPSDNAERALAHIRQAARNGAEIVCLPELFCTQYFCQREDASLFDLAETIPGPASIALSEVARQEKVTVIGSLFEKRAPGLYHNTAIVISPLGEIIGAYRKMHIPDDPLYHEKFYFTPGDLGFAAIDTPVGRVGPLVCWDQWYPEAARLTALQGANILFYPTAIGWHPAEKGKYGAAQHDAWLTIQRSHAIANGVFVAAANRVGHEHGDIRGNAAAGPGLEFWGGSFICGPFGEILSQAAHDKEEVLAAEINLKHLEDVRRNWPFLRDRRIDFYDGITRRFND